MLQSMKTLASVALAVATLLIGPQAHACITQVGIGGSSEIDIVGNRLFSSDGATTLRVFDITDPLNPVLEGSVAASNTIRGFAAGPDYAYLAVSGSGLDVVDLSAPSGPTIVNTLPIGFGYAAALSGNHLVVCLGIPTVAILDVSTPAAPVTLTTTDFGNEYNAGIDVAFVPSLPNHPVLLLDTSSSGGSSAILRVMDMTDPWNPFLPAGTTRTYPWGIQTNQTQYPRQFRAVDDLLYVSLAQNTFSSLLALAERFEITTTGLTRTGVLSESPPAISAGITPGPDDTMYWAVGGEIRKVSTTDPATLTEVGTYSSAGSLASLGGFLFTGTGGSLKRVDLSCAFPAVAAPFAGSGDRFRAWPNPFRDVVFVQWDAPAVGPAEILDVTGRRIASLEAGNDGGTGIRTWRPRAETPAGVYYVRLSDGRTQQVVRTQ